MFLNNIFLAKAFLVSVIIYFLYKSIYKVYIPEDERTLVL